MNWSRAAQRKNPMVALQSTASEGKNKVKTVPERSAACSAASPKGTPVAGDDVEAQVGCVYTAQGLITWA